MRLGLRRISELSVRPTGKSHESRLKRSHQSNVGRVFYIEISKKFSGTDVARILKTLFGNFKKILNEIKAVCTGLDLCNSDILRVRIGAYFYQAGSYTEAISPVAISPSNKAIYHLRTK